MQDGRESEDDKTGGKRTPSSPNKRGEDMSFHEMVHRSVPGAPVRAYAGAIPPFAVELPVSKPHYFCQSVQEGLEQGKESR